MALSKTIRANFGAEPIFHSVSRFYRGPRHTLLGAVVGLLCKREIGGSAVDFGLALVNNFGTRPEIYTLQFRIGHRFLGFGLAQLGNQLEIVDDEQGCTRCNAFWPRATAIASSSRIGPRCAA